MKVDALIRMIPSERLEELAVSTQVDHYSKKLQGEIVFRLLLYCLITRKENSLRTMRSAYESITFKALQNKKGISHSSISERLSSIEVSYFEGLFKDCVWAYKNLDGINKDHLLKFDSTIVSLSANLINIGYKLSGGSESVKQLKFTVGYSDIPEVVHFYHEQQFTSENLALKDTILTHARADNLSTIRVFDRGITARSTYDTLTSKGIYFVSRLNNNAKKQTISSNETISGNYPIKTASLTIISDQWCYLFSSAKRSEYPIRCIEAYRNDTNEKIVFISNIKDATAQGITEIYRKRWDIEVFFKFLKQVLNFKHLINRNENGIQVMLYVTMIAAILLEAYKKANKLTGYKIPLQELEQELEKEVTRNIVLLCGGNTDTFDRLFGSNST